MHSLWGNVRLPEAASCYEVTDGRRISATPHIQYIESHSRGNRDVIVLSRATSSELKWL